MSFSKNEKINLSSLRSPIENGLQYDSSRKKLINICGFMLIISLLSYFEYSLKLTSEYFPFLSDFLIYISAGAFAFFGLSIKHLFVGFLSSTVKMKLGGDLVLRINNSYNTTFFDIKIHYDIVEFNFDDRNYNVYKCIWRYKEEIGSILSCKFLDLDWSFPEKCIKELEKSENYLLIISILYVDGTFGLRKISKILLTRKHLRDGIMHSLP